MISLCFAVLSSSLVAIIMRLSNGRVKYNLGMLAMNYIVCTLLSGLSGGFAALPQLGQGRVLAMGAVNGALYLAGFVLMQFNTRCSGVVLSSVFQKLGLLVSMSVSVLVYRQVPTALQGLGFLLAVAAIVLMNLGKGHRAGAFHPGLVWMLLTCGMASAMNQVFKESGGGQPEGLFLFCTFATAMVLCAGLTAMRGQRIGRKEVLFGTMIAVPNFFSTKFVLGALESLSAVIVQPVNSVGTILVVTLTGMLLFRERLTRQQWIGIAVILVALVLLNV